MTRNPEHMISWCESRESHWAWFTRELTEALAVANVAPDECASVNAHDLVDWCNARDALGKHEGHISPSSIAFNLRDYLDSLSPNRATLAA